MTPDPDTTIIRANNKVSFFKPIGETMTTQTAPPRTSAPHINEAISFLEKVPGADYLISQIRTLEGVDTSQEEEVQAELLNAFRKAKEKKQGDHADSIAYAISMLASKGLPLPFHPIESQII
jgi:hypothetical protein